MKGIDFFEVVNEKLDNIIVDKLLTISNLSRKEVSIYVDTYDHNKMGSLVVNLNHETDVPISALFHTFALCLFKKLGKTYRYFINPIFASLRIFGAYLFKKFSKIYGYFINNTPNAFMFLKSVLNYIYIEVIDSKTLILYYKSIRKIADLSYKKL